MSEGTKKVKEDCRQSDDRDSEIGITKVQLSVTISKITLKGIRFIQSFLPILI